MRMPGMARLRTVAGWVCAAIAGVALGGFLFAWSGVYNIAASRGHWAVVEWLLSSACETRSSAAPRHRRAAARRSGHASLGAAHFHSGCAIATGRPGIPGDRSREAVLPPPPDLDEHLPRAEGPRAVLDRQARHQIHRHAGLGRAGARRRGLGCRRFLKKLPRLSRDAYRGLAIGAAETPPQSGRDIALDGCHGGRGRRVRALPRRRADADRRAAWCRSCTASPANFSPQRCKRMRPAARPAASCSRSRPNSRRTRSISSPPIIRRAGGRRRESGDDRRSHGRRWQRHGDPAAEVPACTGCHDAKALATYPRLAGQNAAYMANRLRLWKNGLAAINRRRRDHGADRAALSDQQIEDVSAYFAPLRLNASRGARP